MGTTKGTFSIRTEVLDGQKSKSTLDEIGSAGKKAFQNIDSASKGAASSAGTAAGQVKRVHTQVIELKSVTGNMEALLRRAFAIAAITRFTSSVISAGLAMERIQIGLKQIRGTAEGAQEEFEFLRQTSDRLGTDLFDSAQGFIKLAAAARGTVVEGQAVRNIFTAISEASAVYRLSAEQTAGALKAVEQIISKNRLSSEELRQQLSERLPGAFRIAADAMGVSTEKLEELIKSGKVGLEFIDQFAAAIRRDIGGGVADASNSAQAAINRLRNEYQLMLSELAQSGVLQTVATGARILAQNIDGIAAAVAGLAAAGFTVLLAKWVTAAGAAIAAAGGLGAAIAVLLSPIILLAAAIAAVVGGLVYLGLREDEATKRTRELNEAVVKLRQGQQDLKVLTGELAEEKKKELDLIYKTQEATIQERLEKLKLAQANRDVINSIREKNGQGPFPFKNDLNKDIEANNIELFKLKAARTGTVSEATQGNFTDKLSNADRAKLGLPPLKGDPNGEGKTGTGTGNDFINVPAKAQSVQEYVEQLQKQLEVESAVDESTKRRLQNEIQLKENLKRAEDLAEQEINRLKNKGIKVTEEQKEKIIELTKAIFEASEARRIEAERIKLVNDLNESYLEIIPNLELAQEAIIKWKEETIKALEEVGAATPENLSKIDAVVKDKLDKAYDDNLKKATDWESGIIRGARRIADEVPTYADIAEKAFVDMAEGIDKALDEMLETGKINLNSLKDLVGSISRDIAGSAIKSGIKTILGSALNAFTGAVFGSFGGASGAAPIQGLGQISVRDLPPIVAHSGGEVGRSSFPTRNVHPATFANARRFHNGLYPDEMPAILQKGETVLPKGMSAGGGTVINMTVVTRDADSFRNSRGQVVSDLAGEINRHKLRNK